jgi:hypothetical protein
MDKLKRNQKTRKEFTHTYSHIYMYIYITQRTQAVT